MAGTDINKVDRRFPFNKPIELGNSTTPFTNMTTGDEIFSTHTRDSTCTGDTIGQTIYLYGNSGSAGAGTLKAVNHRAIAEDGSDLGSIHGSYAVANTQDGSTIVNDVTGVCGYADIDTGSTAGTGYYQGISGVLDSDVDLAGCEVAGAVVANVKHKATDYNIDGCFVATREGTSSTATGAAYKYKAISTDTVVSLVYGVDLYSDVTAVVTAGGFSKADIRFATGNHMKFDSAAPSAGTWVQGDVVWNTGATASGTAGWICTTAGTPGTWKAFGTIAA